MAGFHVTGIDIKPQPRYCGEEFICADVMQHVKREWMMQFDFIWASPPCQAYSVSRTRSQQPKDYPELIEPVRALLLQTGLAFVIENVPGAPLLCPILLCGCAFSLGARCEDGQFRPLRRHRLFETRPFVLGTGCVCGSLEKCGVYGNGGGWANRFSVDRRGYKGH